MTADACTAVLSPAAPWEVAPAAKALPVGAEEAHPGRSLGWIPTRAAMAVSDTVDRGALGPDGWRWKYHAKPATGIRQPRTPTRTIRTMRSVPSCEGFRRARDRRGEGCCQTRRGVGAHSSSSVGP